MKSLPFVACVAGVLAAALACAQSYTLNVNAAASKRAISPYIYGVSYGSQAEMRDLNSPVNRMGGNNTSRYNWQINADNRGADWFFESIGDTSSVPGERVDTFIGNNKAAGAQSMFTIPMLGWVAKLGTNRDKLASFSVQKYGPQTQTDYWMPDAGNGISTASGNPFITGNDPNDANVPSNGPFQQGLITHITSKWGQASAGGLKYYLMDNEPSIWFSTHRDVHPVGPKMYEVLSDILNYAGRVKATDPSALVAAPEEWGWSGYFLSGYDQQYGAAHGWNLHPDRDAHSGMDYIPYLLEQFHNYELAHHQRLWDVLSLHYYPQDGSYSADVSSAAQALRNKSTRSLWDPNYVDQSWINDKVQLIPRMQGWVNTYYPGTLTAITEYNWGADGNINGATTQADILGIFGRYGLYLATRWTCPDPATPTYKAMKMYRNYDGLGNGFGDTSVADTGSNPDDLASYAAVRTKDGALTVMLINKVGTPATVGLNLSNFAGNGTSQVWQLTASNQISQLSDIEVSSNKATLALPGQSVTLLVMPPSSQKVVPPPPPTGLAAYPLDKSAFLSWNLSPGAMRYTVWRSLSATSGFVNVGTTTLTNFSATGLTNGTTYYFEIVASNTAGSSKASAVVKVVPNPPPHDPAQYNFESSVQGWSSSGGMISGVGTSLVQKFLGAYSLAVTISASGGDSQTVSVLAPPTPAGKTVTFHVWLPLGCQLSSIQPYLLQGASGGWTWTGNWQSISNLKLGSWNTITVTVPSNAATPLYSLGVQFSTNQAWSGVCYVDSVGW